MASGQITKKYSDRILNYYLEYTVRSTQFLKSTRLKTGISAETVAHYFSQPHTNFNSLVIHDFIYSYACVFV